MGLDRFTKTPCGFCFVEYYTHQDALDCLKYIGGTKLDERIIRTDLDPGFEEGRQYGYVFCGENAMEIYDTNLLTAVESLEVRSATNTEKSMTLVVVVTGVLTPTINGDGRKRNMAKVGNQIWVCLAGAKWSLHKSISIMRVENT